MTNKLPNHRTKPVEKEIKRQEAIDYLERAGAFEREVKWAVDTAAYGVSRRFTEYLQRDDVAQHLWEWVLRSPIKVSRWHQDNDADGFNRLLGAVLWDEATYLGRKARDEVRGHTSSDDFYYTKSMLITLLPDVFNEEAWINGPSWNKGQSKVREGKALNEGFGWVATLSDVSRAVSKLPLADQHILRLTYEKDLTRRELAQHFGIPLSTASDRHGSAVKKLWAVLGGPRWLTRVEDRQDDDGHWPAGRRAMSNAEARYVTAKELACEKNEWGSE